MKLMEIFHVIQYYFHLLTFSNLLSISSTESEDIACSAFLVGVVSFSAIELLSVTDSKTS